MQPRLCSRGYLQSRGEGQRPLVDLQEDSQGQRDVGVPLHLLAVRQSGSQVNKRNKHLHGRHDPPGEQVLRGAAQVLLLEARRKQEDPQQVGHAPASCGGCVSLVPVSASCRRQQTHIPVSAVSTDVRTTLNMTLASMRSPNAPSRDIPPRCLRCLETLEIGVSRQAARQPADPPGPPVSQSDTLGSASRTAVQ